MYRARKTRLLGLLPTVAVGFVLLVALVSPSRKPATSAAAPGLPTIESLADCALINEPAIASFENLQIGAGLTQPLGTVANFQACSLTVVPTPYMGGRLDVLIWDPATLAPDPSTVALRSLGFSISASETWESKLGMGLGGTVVMQAVPGVADPPRSTAALELRGAAGTGSVGWDPNTSSTSPAALSVDPGGVYQVLPGAHPVLSHFVCGGDAATQQLRLIQCVMSTNTLNPGSGVTLAQKFRVPRAATLQSVEIALAPVAFNSYPDRGTILILDAAGQSEPPAEFSSPLYQANYYAPDNGRAAWMYPFNAFYTPTLVPDHDYWLIVDTGLRFSVYMKDLTGTESPYFTSNIGPMFSRSASYGAFTLIPSYVLDFRLVGTPTTTVSVGSLAPSRAVLNLTIAPNPARANVSVTWSGAVAGVRFEVLDERGRRVSLGDWQTAAAGRWTWGVRNDRGAAVPPGVYFVRAVDGSGMRAMRRIVLIR